MFIWAAAKGLFGILCSNVLDPGPHWNHIYVMKLTSVISYNLKGHSYKNVCEIIALNYSLVLN
jgi:hypothetical protein